MTVFDRQPIFDASTPLTSPTIYLNRLAETSLHHNRVGSVAFVENAKHTDRHAVKSSAVLADYDLMSLHLRSAGYRRVSAPTPNSSKRTGGNACINTLTEIWVKE